MKLRIQSVDPGQLALIVVMLQIPALVIYAAYVLFAGLLRQGPEPLLYALGAVMASGVAGLILGLLFNRLAPLVGGLTVEVLQGDPGAPGGDERAAPASAEASSTKLCPKCSYEMNAARSFCPECDHDFGDLVQDKDAPAGMV